MNIKNIVSTKKMTALCFVLVFFILSCNLINPALTIPSGENKIIIPEHWLSVKEQAEDLNPHYNHRTLFKKGDYGSKFFRIPALITTKKGTLLAATDRRYNKTDDVGKQSKIDVIVRRSENLGKTWGSPILIGLGAKNENGSDAYGDPFFINAHNGDIIAGVIVNPGIQVGDNKGGPTILYRSSDDGKSWRQVYTFGYYADSENKHITAGYNRGFAASGRGITITRGALAEGNNKSLMFAYMAWNGASSHILPILSKDDGITWNRYGFSAASSADETKVIDLSDGTLMLNHRRHVNLGKRGWSKNIGASEGGNGNESWTPQGEDPEVLDPGNNADFVRYSFLKFANDGSAATSVPIKGEKWVLMINANVNAGGGWFLNRKNHYVRLTKNDFNDGNGNSSGKYAYEKQLLNGGENLYSGYPTITVLPDGSIGTLTEEVVDDGTAKPSEPNTWDKYDLVFRRFNLHWLTGGNEYIDYTEEAFQDKLISK